MVDTNKLKGKIVERGMTQAEVAEKIGISKATYYRKMKEGGNFSIEEVNKMTKIIPLSDSEAINIFFGNDVAIMRQNGIVGINESINKLGGK